MFSLSCKHLISWTTENESYIKFHKLSHSQSSTGSSTTISKSYHKSTAYRSHKVWALL